VNVCSLNSRFTVGTSFRFHRLLLGSYARIENEKA
jgi:hypothetical protein